MWLYSNVDLCNHPAIISIFWMGSHLSFFSYILSFHSLRSRRLEVVGTREKGGERWRHARGTQAKFSSLMCINFHQIPVHFSSVFQLRMRRKRKPGTTQPFYLYIIHEHSIMHMIHELCAFVDRVKCLKVTNDTNSLLDLECSSVLKNCSAACSYLSSPTTAFILIPVLTMNALVTLESVTLFLSVFTRAFTFTFLYP